METTVWCLAWRWMTSWCLQTVRQIMSTSTSLTISTSVWGGYQTFCQWWLQNSGLILPILMVWVGQIGRRAQLSLAATPQRVNFDRWIWQGVTFSCILNVEPRQDAQFNRLRRQRQSPRYRNQIYLINHRGIIWWERWNNNCLQTEQRQDVDLEAHGFTSVK